MKVLQILPELNVGGVETGTVDFAKYLVEHGHKSVIISNGGKLVADIEKTGTKHYCLPVHKKSLFSIVRLIKIVRSIIIREEIEIVHARSRVPAWIAYFACRRTNASFITTCHGYYKNKLFSQVMGFSKIVIVPSKAIARHMIDDFNMSSKSIRCISRSVNLEKFNINAIRQKGKSDATVAIIGRITPLKGHTYFIKSMAKVVRSAPYVKVWIIGDVPAKKVSYKHELEGLVNRLGLKNNIEFLGNRQDVPSLLKEVDVLVLSTVTQESFGRVILEAQAVGVPVVATKVGGVVDIIDDEKTGLLVEPKDIDAMAKAVLRLLNDRKLADNFVDAARTKIKEQFTLEHMASRTIKVYEELLNSLNILVIKISSIGDVVLVTPSLKALRQKFPNANIYCLIGQDSKIVLQNCPYINGIIVCDFKNNHKGFYKFFKLSRKLRRYRFDKIIDFQNSKKSHLLSFLSFPKENFAFDNKKWSFLVSDKLKTYRNDIPAVFHQFQLLSHMGVEVPSTPVLELWPSANDYEYVKSLMDSEWLGNTSKLIGINMAASKKWQTKNWPLEYVAKLCEILAQKGFRIVITGVEKDRDVAKKLQFLTRAKPAILVGKTDVLQLAALIKKCKVFITPDSSPMHIAAAMDVPFIAFFGPTDSRRHVPPASKKIILERKLTCTPCYKTRCAILTHACLTDIHPEEVVKAIESLLE